MDKALAAVKTLKKGDNSIIVNDLFVVVKLGRNRYRLGEVMGDWIMQGTAEEVIKRAYGLTRYDATTGKQVAA